MSLSAILQLSKISTYKPETGPMVELYQLATKGASRQEAMQYFTRDGKSRIYFNTILNRLKNRLMEGVLQHNFNHRSKFIQAAFKIYNDVVISLKLIRSGDKVNGIPKAEKTFKKCLDYGLTNKALELSLELLNYYTLLDTNNKKYKYYSTQSTLLQQEYHLETSLVRLFSEFVYQIKKKKQTDHISNSLAALSQHMPGMLYRSNLFYFSIQNLTHRQNDDTLGIISTCKEAIQHFARFKHLPITTSWNFNRQMIPILIGEGKTGEAELIAKQCIQITEKGNYNWHVSLIYLALVGFHSGKPSIALQAYRTAQKHKKFENSSDISDRWQLIRCYLMLYAKKGVINIPDKFRIYRFLNSITNLQADKARSNVSVIIAELLHLWTDGKKEKFGKRIKQLPNYVHRYLRENEKSFYFLKIMDKQYEAVYKKKATKEIPILLNKLNECQANIGPNVFETEVIPMGVAWEMMTGEKTGIK